MDSSSSFSPPPLSTRANSLLHLSRLGFTSARTLHPHHLLLPPPPPHSLPPFRSNHHLHNPLPSFLLLLLRSPLSLLPFIPFNSLHPFRLLLNSALLLRPPTHLHRSRPSLARDLRPHHAQPSTMETRVQLENSLPRFGAQHPRADCGLAGRWGRWRVGFGC